LVDTEDTDERDESERWRFTRGFSGRPAADEGEVDMSKERRKEEGKEKKGRLVFNMTG
jgi:hypothetical protein